MTKRLFGASGPPPERDPSERLTRMEAVIRSAPGSPYAGRSIYTERCGSCHRLFHRGGRVGPDLTSYQRDDLRALLRGIALPSAEIRAGYESYVVLTTGGRTLSGFIADQDTNVVMVRGVDGNDIALARESIAAMLPAGRSLMPEGLLDGLADQQLRDLFAYLRVSQPILK